MGARRYRGEHENRNYICPRSYALFYFFYKKNRPLSIKGKVESSMNIIREKKVVKCLGDKAQRTENVNESLLKQ